VYGKLASDLVAVSKLMENGPVKSAVIETASGALPLFEIARVLVRFDHYKKPHDSENRAAFIRHYPRPRRLTTQPLRDQPHANCLCLRKKHARECRV
jgi:hypothetical protein